MIHVFIRGRLGNQLFQYAFVRSLQKQNPEQKVCYHFDEVYNSGTEKDDFINALKNFNVVDVNESHQPINLSLFQKILLKLYWRKFPHSTPIHLRDKYQRKWVGLLNKFNLIYLDHGYYPFNKKLSGDVIVSGQFESESFFSEIKESILQEITPKHPISSANYELVKRMKETNSISLSIRRGDFVNNVNIGQLHHICTIDYYKHAWEYMKTHVENPVLFIFSNDIEWVKKNLDFGVETHYESGKDPSWEVMELMSNCKHFIMSNSTFNWWAQYKNNNPTKIVVAPEKWWNSPLVPDIFMKNWKLISINQ